MKKLMTLALALTLCLGLFAGCGNRNPDTADKTPNNGVTNNTKPDNSTGNADGTAPGAPDSAQPLPNADGGTDGVPDNNQTDKGNVGDDLAGAADKAGETIGDTGEAVGDAVGDAANALTGKDGSQTNPKK